ncbi:MAG: alkaline phosphatase family protein [Conexivisphaerales archaeon]
MRKLVFIGIDGGMHGFVKKFAEEGLMPNLSSLIGNGAFFKSLPSLPVDTPTNWTTLMSSANSLTHGVVSFTTHLPGESAEEGQYIRRTQHSSFIKSEMLWSTLERAGRKVAVLNYPVAWPSQLERGTVIGGLTPGGDVWRMAKPKIFSTEEPLSIANSVKKTKPSFIRIEEGQKKLEIETREGSQTVSLECDGSSLTLIGPDYRVRLSEGEWSDWIYTAIGNGKKGVFRVKLVRNKGCKNLTIYFTQLFSADGWCSSNEIEEKVKAFSGPYIEGLETPFVSDDPKRPYGPSNLSPSFVLEHAKMQSGWFSKTGALLLKEERYDSLIMHYHLIDSLNHTYLSSMCKRFPAYDERDAELVERIYRDSYHLIDDMIGELVQAAGKETLYVVTSDHSALPCWKYVSVEAALAKSGLVVYEEKGEGRLVADMKRSRVFVYHDPLHLWVNLKGREKNGVVEKWEYESVVEEAIDVLNSIRDPDTNERVMKAILKKSSFGKGRSEERFGDAFFFFKPGYSNWDGTVSSLKFDAIDESRLNEEVRLSYDVGGHHTTYLPNETYEGFENHAFTVISGEGVRNETLYSMPELRDIAVTLCHLLGIDAPKDADGRVIYEIL